MPLRIATTITFCQLLLTDAREVVVVQLKLLGLTIPEESGIVRMDAMMRADLIDLMARILMEVASMRSGSQQCVIAAQGSALSRPIPPVQIASGRRDSVHVLVHVRLRHYCYLLRHPAKSY
jgi:hypothetical protein